MEVVVAFRVSNFDTVVSHLDKIDERFTWLASQLPFQHKSSQVTVHVSFWSSSLNKIPFSVSPHTFYCIRVHAGNWVFVKSGVIYSLVFVDCK
jgi:hypothetical protein